MAPGCEQNKNKKKQTKERSHMNHPPSLSHDPCDQQRFVPIFFSVWCASPSRPPSATVIVSGTSPPWPLMYSVSPDLMACEYGPSAEGAFVVLICFQAVSKKKKKMYFRIVSLPSRRYRSTHAPRTSDITRTAIFGIGMIVFFSLLPSLSLSLPLSRSTPSTSTDVS